MLFRPLVVTKHFRWFASSSAFHANSSLFSRDDEFMKKYTEKASQRSIGDKKEGNVWEDATIVKTTGIVGIDGSNRFVGRFGVFWGAQDKMNVYKAVEPTDGVISIALAELEAVNMALRQAIHERNLNRVLVHSDSEFVTKTVDRWLAGWKNNDFKKRDGTPVKNRAHLEELDRLLMSIEAKILFTTHKTRYENDVIAALRENEELAPLIDADAPLFGNTPHIAQIPKDKPVVYTSGTVRDIGNQSRAFTLAGYGSYWPDAPEFNKCGRFAEFPITLFRAQMVGIIMALKQAKEQGLKEVCVVTDSDRFLRFRQTKWMKKDGTPVANYGLYKEIFLLSKGIDVQFAYMPQKFNAGMEQALMLAEDGLAYPIEKREILS